MTVRWGFIAAGAIATRSLAPAVHFHGGSVLQVAAARDPARAAALEPVRTADSYAEVVAADDVDAVYISLPPSMHEEWAVAALRAGKPVVCEKPMGCSADEVSRMQQVAESEQRLLVEALMWRWQPRVAEFATRVAAIEPVRRVSAGFGFGGLAVGDFRWQRSLGGGALLDLGCYPLSAAYAVIGDRLLDALVSARAVMAASGQGDADVRVDAVLDLGDIIVDLTVSMQDQLGQWLVVSGERGEVDLSPDPFTGGTFNPWAAMVDGVVRALEGDPSGLAVTPEATHAVAMLCDRIRAACDS